MFLEYCTLYSFCLKYLLSLLFFSHQLFSFPHTLSLLLRRVNNLFLPNSDINHSYSLHFGKACHISSVDMDSPRQRSGHNPVSLQQNEASNSNSVTHDGITIFNSSLDSILRNDPSLSARPREWSQKHADLFKVAYKNERPLSLSHKQELSLKVYEKWISDKDLSLTGTGFRDLADSRVADINAGTPCVPNFVLPNKEKDSIYRNIEILCNPDVRPMNERTRALHHLLCHHPKTSDYSGSSFHPTRSNTEGVSSIPENNGRNEGDNTQNRRLTCQKCVIHIKYGKASFEVMRDCRVFTLGGNRKGAKKHSWCLLYFDRSDFIRKSESRRHRKAWSNRAISRRPSNYLLDEDHARHDTWPLSQGQMAGVFLSMATSAGNLSRYQVLLTDVENDQEYMHLFTAQVSPFLVAHFRKPARPPRPKLPLCGNDGSLIKIHHTVIPFHEKDSFRGRLRMTISTFANGTAGGFFTHNRPRQVTEQKGEQDRSRVRRPSLMLRAHETTQGQLGP